MVTFVDLMHAEHINVRRALNKLFDSTSGRPDERAAALERTRITLEPLLDVEERIVYPLLATYPELTPKIEELRRLAEGLRPLLDELDRMSKTDPMFQHRAELLYGQAEQQSAREEEDLLPIVRRLIAQGRIDEEAAEMLAERFEEELRHARSVLRTRLRAGPYRHPAP